MPLAFDAPAYKGGRHILRCGKVAVGAIFPPPEGAKDWQWRCWINEYGWVRSGQSKTEATAKAALRAAFSEFLAAAGLQVAP